MIRSVTRSTPQNKGTSKETSPPSLPHTPTKRMLRENGRTPKKFPEGKITRGTLVAEQEASTAVITPPLTAARTPLSRRRSES